MIALIIIAAVAAFCVFLLSLKLKIKTAYKNNNFSVKISVFGITVFHNLKKEEKKEAVKKAEKENSGILNLLMMNKDSIAEDLKHILKFARRKIHVNSFFIDLTFGAKDSADTGILCGGVWAFIGTVFPVLESSLTFDDVPVINVTPVFNKIEFILEYKGNYTLRIIHILRLGIKMLFKFLKYKGGVNNGSTASN